MDYMTVYSRWLSSPYLTDGEKSELLSVKDDKKEIESRFCSLLQFGTAGLRGVMGVGINRMNVRVIRHATQAFALVILAEGRETVKKGVGICYDCRIGSAEFAREAACVMAANGIPVKMFEALRPTPELSFAIREYGFAAGLNITASHNPKEYNGYKVYWSDGAQLPPHHAAAIAEKMNELDIFTSIKTMDFDEAVNGGLISLMGEETDERFLANVMAQATDTETVAKVADSFKMVYTPFHGTGYKLIPEALRRLGMKHVICVPEQMKVDGTFPTVVSPNPENPEGFYLAIDLAKKNGADFILGSDPDADRVGIMVRNRQGEYIVMSGNQTGVLLLDYIISAKKRAGRLPDKATALKTIVTTDMAKKIAEANGVKSYDTFTGFKFMAEKKNHLEADGQGKVIFAYEESFGYMIGDYVRDKDAVTAALMLTEMAAWYFSQGMTLYDALQELYKKYGYHAEKTINVVLPGLDGLARMGEIMTGLRNAPPAELGGSRVTVYRDYSDGSERNAVTGEKSSLELSGSNVLSFITEAGDKVLVRPSGTEPKIKIYILTSGRDAEECARKVEACSAWAESIR